MNLFFLDEDVSKCAISQVDSHVVKLPLELSQMICTAHHVHRGGYDIPYKKAYENHPTTKWVRATRENYIYTITHGLSLCAEYTYRYGKVHGCERVLLWGLHNIPELPRKPFYPPPCAMDTKYLVLNEAGKVNTIESYRNYYRVGKKHLHVWKKREKPSWI